jgi:hypothetical protein
VRSWLAAAQSLDGPGHKGEGLSKRQLINLTVFILAGDIYKNYMVFKCNAGRTSPTQKPAGILCEAGFKAEQARIKGDIWQSKVFRTRESLKDIV